jgi:hypothetical protein
MFTKYISSEGVTLNQLAIEYSVTLRAVEMHCSKDSWVKKREEAMAKAMELAEIEAVKIIKERNDVHIDRATRILEIATKQLDAGVVPKNAKDLISWVSESVKIERLARQMDSKSQSLSFNKKNQSIVLTWGDNRPVESS